MECCASNPILHYSTSPIALSFHLGKCSFERSKMPKILHLEVFARQGTGETIELQVILGRALGASVIGKDAVLHGFFKERKNLLLHLGGKFL